ncbi:MAG: hypothetical protein M3247_09050 [Thermoproteota archaeon]|nr:hypothetical protein [Thermoproteota archaeon]
MSTSFEKTITKAAPLPLLVLFVFSVIGYSSSATQVVYAQIPGVQSGTNEETTSDATTTTNNTATQPAASSTNQGITEGRIVSLVEDKSGNPTAILSGRWSMKLPSLFNATITMVNPDGTGSHRHRIEDFKATGNSAVNTEELKAMNGTASITMPEGTPIKKVPVSVRLLNNSTLSLTVDPKSTGEHLGSRPIYGVIIP